MMFCFELWILTAGRFSDVVFVPCGRVLGSGSGAVRWVIVVPSLRVDWWLCYFSIRGVGLCLNPF